MTIIKNCCLFFKKNIILSIAIILALITSFLVPVDKYYLNYFDYKTLTCLFCVLTVVCALKNINFFYIVACKIVKCCKNIRTSIIMLVYITFIGSMLIANDMALLTFLPLGYFVLVSTNNKKHMAFTFIMQNIAANLGGMLTPFGNPQNLYIYNNFNIPTPEFVSIMFPPFIISILLITICCLFIKPTRLEIQEEKVEFNLSKALIYFVLFALSIAIIFRGIPYWIGLIVIPLSMIFLDKKALRNVDYPLLFTFVFFFVFSGNMARIEIIQNFFSTYLEKSTLIFSIISCQFISNVPSAILLSQFTSNYPDLLLGVNIGGTGTLIASLASLITFKEYIKHNPDKTKHYIALYSLFNFSFLFILTGLMILLQFLTCNI